VTTDARVGVGPRNTPRAGCLQRARLLHNGKTMYDLPQISIWCSGVMKRCLQLVHYFWIFLVIRSGTGFPFLLFPLFNWVLDSVSVAFLPFCLESDRYPSQKKKRDKVEYRRYGTTGTCLTENLNKIRPRALWFSSRGLS
jgi:hypothetical protein